ncbi:MAG: hypothetical protein Q8N81_08420 [bacterium]|nr:hypothetical protein [bacterium]
MKHFPSNKLIIPFFLIGLSALAVYFSSARGGPTQIYDKQTASLQVQKEAVENPNLDSDNDGLPEWQEILWKTDPHNPDTDADGTPDGEETKRNRNPLVKGPDDGILETMFSGDKQNNSDFKMPETFTEVIGQQLFTQFLVNKQAGGGKISTEKAQEIAGSVSATIDRYSVPGENVYQNEALQTIPATKENLKRYGNELGAVIKKYFAPIPKDVVQIMGEALTNGDYNKLEELKNLSSAYKNTAIEMMQIKVPESLKNDHLAIANTFYRISKEINGMERAKVDRALALVSVNQYLLDSETAHESLKNINIYFSNNNITFNKEEGGRVFSFYTFS